MELQEFIDALYAAGWDSPCDAQHENIVAVFNSVKEKAANVAYDLGIKAGEQRAKDIAYATANCSDLLSRCRSMFAHEGLVPAVKMYRQLTGCGLKEAVDAIKGR